MVHGRFNSNAKRTVTIYNHLDVQPASRETEPWKTDPFKFTKVGDRYYGRGTTDDKGPALSALWGMRAAREAGVPLNVNVLWELEEEIGSPNFESAIRKHAESSRPITSSCPTRSGCRATGRPPPAGLRGLQGFTLSLEVGETDQHSGVTGGAARNPIGELMKLVSQMYDGQTGQVKIKGFYDDVEKPSKQRARRLPQVGLHGRAVQEGSPVQVDPHERRARGDEAHLGDADVRGARPRRRLHRPGHQDDHPAARRSEDLHATRPESGSAEDHQAGAGVREEEQPRRGGRSSRTRCSRTPHRRPARSPMR